MCKNIHDIKFSWNIVIYALIIILVAAGTIVFIHRFGMPSNVQLSDANLTIVLSFIGVLATFIVIGNFAQISDIKRSMEQELDKVKTDLGNLQTNVNGQKIALHDEIREANDTIKKLRTYTEKHVSDLADTIEAQSDADNSYTKEEVEKIHQMLEEYKWTLFALIASQYGEIDKIAQLMHKLDKMGEKIEFSVVVPNAKSSKTIKATALLLKDEIVFYNEEAEIDRKIIKSIDGIKISVTTLSILYQLYLMIVATTSQKEYSNADEMSTNMDNNTDEPDSIDLRNTKRSN